MRQGRCPARPVGIWVAGILFLITSQPVAQAQFIRIATYNVENYLTQPLGSRPLKPVASRQQICLALRRLQPDVIALQEIGGPAALSDLQQRLRQTGLDLPHAELVEGYDTNIQVALLSRLPLNARRSHPDERFLLHGRRYRTTRGILEVEITLPSAYTFTVMAVHLKSRLASGSAPQEELREQEALVLRRLVDARLRANPEENLIVLGDFNDDKDSLAVRTVLGRGRTRLLDTRPTELSVDAQPVASPDPSARTIAWTHFYTRSDVYSRLDYILLSPGMAREWQAAASYVLAFPGWGEASDHRPLVAAFIGQDQ